MNDEPLDRWAARRQGRLRAPGELKAVTLGSGPHRAAHMNPDAPRMILEWDGFAWQALMIVDNFAEACRILYPTPQPQQHAQPAPPKQPGRHRKP
ncbi:DUF6087 family protein [Streptomyces sp. NBC_01244]|uniref:DUF6087 family protein n=1 Tax=Streptomyces sp. NBC_01244 TaxID=2903797 RepID=UPI002E16039A|nr:DUF6087 family protein [Streptomyces sp. NBC_01244]